MRRLIATLGSGLGAETLSDSGSTHSKVPHAAPKVAQQGALLIELALVLSVILLMAVLAVSSFNHRNAELRMQSLALWMGSVHHALQRYINDHGIELAEAGYLILGVNNPREPTVAELKSTGYLAADFPLGTAQKYSVKTSVFSEPGCSQPPCGIYGLIWAPGVAKSNHDLAYWRVSTAAKGAIITLERPGYISAATSELNNPPHPDVAFIPGGSVALVVTPDTLGLAYLRVGDERNPDFKNNVHLGGELRVRGMAYLHSGLHIAAVNVAQSSCAAPGLVSKNSESNGLLICSGRHEWQGLDSLAGGTFTISGKGQCAHPVLGSTVHPLTKACTCPTGYQNVLISISGNHADDMYSTFACSPSNY
ncbi:type II secretion system GspH family protein [Paenalcaligenes niemegkensis]|uniref:type II secretion system protein n=1 Tax=Paenalcaligenes niemegkensis TaxID=2895469 RepID=UPI001EE84D73|nr:type II secretion system protein [Paenalcaligenes niemegkensis]MCQ9616742.1 type II secretion system GspH family protein [Paenalcaligenes niemegkensis]